MALSRRPSSFSDASFSFVLEQSLESGYASLSPSSSISPNVTFSPSQLKHINQHLSLLEPIDVLKWSIVTFPRLFQTSAFGLTGLAITEMLSSLDGPYKTTSNIELIFLDTLHHFDETLELIERVRARYPLLKINIYKPQGCDTVQDFDHKYGERLWETDEERYDYVAKVEPAQRAYADLDVTAVLTGRRRSQGGRRGDIDIVEFDGQVLKINPMANWTFAQVESFVAARNVPTNALLAKGYRSVGDWHSTLPVTDIEDERAGRWKGRSKSECGIHNKKSRYAMFLNEREHKRLQEETGRVDAEMVLTD